jgi:hypothetical protein
MFQLSTLSTRLPSMTHISDQDRLQDIMTIAELYHAGLFLHPENQRHFQRHCHVLVRVEIALCPINPAAHVLLEYWLSYKAALEAISNWIIFPT